MHREEIPQLEHPIEHYYVVDTENPQTIRNYDTSNAMTGVYYHRQQQQQPSYYDERDHFDEHAALTTTYASSAFPSPDQLSASSQASLPHQYGVNHFAPAGASVGLRMTNTYFDHFSCTTCTLLIIGVILIVIIALVVAIFLVAFL